MKPVDLTPEILARAMRMDASELFALTSGTEHWYNPPRMIPAGKKHRECDVPHPVPMRILRALNKFLQREFSAHPCAHGGVKRRSCFTAAQRHCGRYAVITRDIKDCYPSIPPVAFHDELTALGFRGDVAIILTALFCVRGHVPQGSPCSNDALNLFLYRTDGEIAAAAATFGGRYTRSADDMIISVKTADAVPAAKGLLENAIVKCGLEVNVGKRKVRLRHERQLVHNIDVNSKRGTRVSEAREKSARQAAEGLVRGARSLTASTLIGLAKRRERALGHFHDVRQAYRSPARHIRTQVRIADDLVIRKLRKLGLICHKDKWWLDCPQLTGAWESILRA